MRHLCLFPCHTIIYTVQWKCRAIEEIYVSISYWTRGLLAEFWEMRERDFCSIFSGRGVWMRRQLHSFLCMYAEAHLPPVYRRYILVHRESKYTSEFSNVARLSMRRKIEIHPDGIRLYCMTRKKRPMKKEKRKEMRGTHSQRRHSAFISRMHLILK